MARGRPETTRSWYWSLKPKELEHSSASSIWYTETLVKLILGHIEGEVRPVWVLVNALLMETDACCPQ